MNTIFNTLRTLPLFKGVSNERLNEIVANTRLHFLKYLEGESIVRAGDPCTHIKFIISGQARMSFEGHGDRFRVLQTLTGPDVIAPDYLFGRQTTYPCNATALTQVSVLQIEKAECIKLMKTDEIFLFNFINILSMNAQKSVEGVLAFTSGSVEERIAFWILALTQAGSTDVVLQARHREVYALFNVQRMSFYASLESMKERGLIDYTPNEIKVVSRRALVELLMHHDEE